jgi:ferredoxin
MSSRSGKNTSPVRRLIQVFFFVLVGTVTASHVIERQGIDLGWDLLSTGAFGNFHLLCPFGAIETVGSLLLDGSPVPKIGASNFWILAGVLLSTLVVGSAFCSYLCPLGSVQEWIGRAGRRVFKKGYNRFVSPGLDRMLGYLRYGVLLIILIQTTRLFTLVFHRFDPYYALFRFWSGDVYLSAIGVLGAVVVLSLFFERPWCRWFCPFGALLGIVQRGSLLKIRKIGSHRGETGLPPVSGCNECGACLMACPMGARFHGAREAVLDTRCNRCGACMDACRRGALALAAPGARRSAMTKFGVGALVLVLFMLPILFASRAGLMFPEKSKRRTADMGYGADARATGELRAVMTVEEAAHLMGLDPSDLKRIVGIPEDVDGSVKLYTLEEIDRELTVKKIRTILERYSSDGAGPLDGGNPPGKVLPGGIIPSAGSNG